MNDFPQTISLTITNDCNLRCRMCGQWSEEGYVKGRREKGADVMRLAEWQQVIDEAADRGIRNLLLRGGEPFLYPDILPLLEYIRSKDIFTSIDTNGTLLAQYAADLVRIGKMHLTISINGPEKIHDAVTGAEGTFTKIGEGLNRLAEEEQTAGRILSKSATFTISRDSYIGLGAIPEVARSLGISSLCIVACYYFPQAVGEQYEREMRDHFGCEAYSWRGFHHEDSGVDVEAFLKELRTYRADMTGLLEYPYFPMTEDEYRTWFSDAVTPVGPQTCANVEKLVDIKPNGDANFCVDFPDYVIGNVRQASIEQLWNGQQAEAFRAYRRERPLAVCLRCGAKYMAEIRGAVTPPG
jgi:MoaA/NifB/PqqE/SkfB family radical SAM enzyme